MKNINILCRIKSYFPTSYFFFAVFVLLKAFGPIIISTLTRFSIHQNSFYFLFLNFFTYFSRRSLRLKYSYVFYEALCFVIYVSVILIIILLLILLINRSKGIDKLIHLPTKNALSKDRLIPFFSVFITITALFSHFLIEILSLPVCIIIIDHSNELYLNKEFASNIMQFRSSLKIDIYFYLVINLAIIASLNCLLVFYLKLLNNVHLSNIKIISFTSKNIVIYTFVLAQNMQMFQYYYQFFNEESSCIIIMNRISLVYFLIASIVFVYQLTEVNFCNLAIATSYLLCLSGSVISILYNTFEEKELGIAHMYFRIGIQVISTTLVIYMIYIGKKHLFQIKIPKILFNYNRDFNYDYIYEFIIFIRDCFTDIENITYLYSLLLTHQEACTDMGCDCNSLNITEMKSIIKGSKVEHQFSKKLYEKTLVGIMLIVENKIKNCINLLVNEKKLLKYISLVIFHCNFVFYFKRNYIYALYIIDEYLSQIGTIPFEFKVYLHSFKSKVVKSFHKKSKCSLYDESHIVKCGKFIVYYNHLYLIKSNIEEGLQIYLKILKLKQLLRECSEKSQDRNLNYRTQASSYVSMLFVNCGKFDSHVKKIKQSLTTYSNEYNNDTLANQEICYLLTNFFYVIDKVVPKEIINTFILTNYYTQLNSSVSYYSEIQFSNPMILSIKAASTYNQNMAESKVTNGLYIEYASHQMLYILGYKKDEIINKEINKLIPDFFAKEQSNILQTHFFIQKKVEIELLMLLNTKEKYFKRALGIIGSFPTLLNRLLLICNINILDNDFSLNRFRFLVDITGNIITFTENFAKKYYLTYQMVEKLNISFCSLFGVNIDRLLSEFKKLIHKIQKSDSTSIEKVVNILSSCKLKEFLDVHSNKKKDIVIKEEDFNMYVLTKEREEVRKMVYCIRKEVEEKEVHSLWVSKLNAFESLLFNETNKNNALQIEITLQNIGNIPYFIAVVTDYGKLNYQFLSNKRLLKSEKVLKRYNVNFAKDVRSPSRRVSIKKASYCVEPIVTKHPSVVFDIIDDNLNNRNSSIVSLKEIKVTCSPSQSIKSTWFRYSVINKVKMEETSYMKAESVSISLLDRIFTYILRLLSITIMTIYIVQTYLQQMNFNTLRALSTLNINSIFFKEMYYDTASCYSSLCFRLDDLEPDKAFDIDSPFDDLINKIVKTSNQLFIFLNLLIKTVNNLGSSNERDELFNILYDIIPLKKLNKNWDIEDYNSSLENEIYLTHYHMNILKKRYPVVCRVKEMFFENMDDNKELNENFSFDNIEGNAFPEEVLFIDYFFNSIKAISKRISLFIVKTSRFQELTIKKTHSICLQFSFVLISLMLTEIIIFTLLISSYQRKIITLLIIFVNPSPRITYLENKVTSLLGLIHSFDDQACKAFENVKYTTGGLEIKTSRNSINFKTLSCMKEAKIINQTDCIKEEEDPTELKYNSLNTSIYLITVNYVVIAIFLITFLGIAALDLIENFKIVYNIKLTNEIGRIYLSSVPRLNQIILYYKYSILVNDPLYDQLNPEDYYLYDYSQSDYFSSDIKTENDTRYQALGSSIIAFYFKKFYEEIETMKKYNQNSNIKILPLSRNFQNELDCDELIKGFRESCFSKCTEDNLAEILSNCNNIANGIMKEGEMQLNIEKSVGSIFNLYLEFVKKKDDKDLEKFLMHDDYILAVYELQNIYMYMFITIYHFVKLDIDSYFISQNKITLIFETLLSLEICIIIFTFVIILYPKIISFFHNFKDIVQRIEVSLMDDKQFF